jgi:septum formation protein
MVFPAIYLASQSPRRRELLTQIGVDYSVIAAEVDETWPAAETPAAYVQRLAREKAVAGWQRATALGMEPRPVLGADTTVALDGDVLGKPADLDAARAMLRRLSGRSHQVFTGVALSDGTATAVALSTTTVWFRTLDEADIDAYWATGEPRDKAGAYGIQGLGAVFVERIDGSYSGVVGLPLFETARLLACFS